MWRTIFTIAAFAVALATSALQADDFDGKLKLGVLTDMSSWYQDVTGPGSVLAVQMAVEDFLEDNPNSGLKPTVISADHQHKPDVGAALAREWFQVGGVDAVIDVPNSAVALAVAHIAKQFNKAYLNTSAGTTRLTGDLCGPTTVKWNFDNYGLATGTARAVAASGGDSWFFVTADYAGGHDLEAQASATVKAQGGRVLGAVRASPGTADFSSFLVQARSSGAKVVGLAIPGADLVNAVKGAAEFGITPAQKLAGLVIALTDVHSLGLPVAKGLLFTESFYWGMNEAARAWSERFFKRHHAYPTSNQAAAYSATLHFLKAAAAAKTRDGRKLIDQMKAMPTDDPLFGKGYIREDGREMHPMYLFEAKQPSESKGEWDLYKLVKTIPAEKAWRPLNEGGCALIGRRG